MTTGPKVSILIPCHNAEPWLRQCVESALNQTYRNMEVIAIDDGSTDGSWTILQSFGERITAVRTEQRGSNAARNQLLQMSSGEWLQYLDADDYMLLDKIEQQMEHLRQHAGAELVYSPVVDFYEETGRKEEIPVDPAQDQFVHYIGWGAYATHAMLMLRAAVVEVGGWNESQPCCQEHELLLRLLMAGKKFSFSRNAGAIYRAHGSNTISKRSPELVVRQRMKLLDALEEHLLKTSAMKPEYRQALCQARFDCARKIYTYDRNYAVGLIKQLRGTLRRFVPSGPSAPLPYRVLYMTLGFEPSERIATIQRKCRGLLRGRTSKGFRANTEVGNSTCSAKS